MCDNALKWKIHIATDFIVTWAVMVGLWYIVGFSTYSYPQLGVGSDVQRGITTWYSGHIQMVYISVTLAPDSDKPKT